MTAASTTWLAHPLIAAILARAETLPPSVETLREQLDDAANHIGLQRERIKALEAALTSLLTACDTGMRNRDGQQIGVAMPSPGAVFRARAVLSGEAK